MHGHSTAAVAPRMGGAMEIPDRLNGWVLAFGTLLLLAIALFPSVWIGGAGLGLIGWYSRRFWSAEDAIWAMLIVACVWASSRSGGLQYWKWMRFIPAVALLGHAFKKLRSGTRALRASWLSFTLLVLVITGFPGLLSKTPGSAFFETVLLSTLWPCYLILCMPQNEKAWVARESMVFHVGAVVLLAAVVLRMLNPELSHLDSRWRGMFGNPNEFSHWWLLMFVVLGVRGLRQTGTKYAFWTLVTAGILALTATRGALIGIVLSGMGFVFARARTGTVKGLVFLACIAVAAVVYTDEVVGWAKDVLPEYLVREENLELGGGRLVAWEFGWAEVMKEPWWGHGGGYEEQIFKEFEAYLSLRNHQGFSHNSWLAFAINYGIPGATLLFVALFTRLKLFTSPFALLALPPIVVSLVVEGWLTAPLSASAPLFFAVSGLTGAWKASMDHPTQQKPEHES